MKRKSSAWKRILVMLAVPVMGAALTACGAKGRGNAAGTEQVKETPQEAGSYLLYEITDDGETYDRALLVSMDMGSCALVLEEDGTGWMDMDERETLTWKDGVITFDGDGTKCPYELSEDTITLTEDSGTVTTFMKADALPEEYRDAAATEEEAVSLLPEEIEGASDLYEETASEGETDFQRYWNGDWYVACYDTGYVYRYQ